jgi:hypothetical protein
MKNKSNYDKYYTSSKIVDKCFNIFIKNIKINDNDLCIEPSAGNGAFINLIKNLFKNYIFYDILPEHEDIIQQDYLLLNLNHITNLRLEKNINKIHIIGNPPFGKQSSLAIKFIKKSCEYCDTLSFILPKSFNKESLKKHFPLNFHLEYSINLPNNSFFFNDKYYNVPCIFQIWIKKDNQRKIIHNEQPCKYNFVKKEKEHDISFRRVGINAGEISKNTDNKSIQSHYFIKFDNQLIENIYNKLSNITFECKNDTCGPKSISKQELIKEFNKIII